MGAMASSAQIRADQIKADKVWPNLQYFTVRNFQGAGFNLSDPYPHAYDYDYNEMLQETI